MLKLSYAAWPDPYSSWREFCSDTRVSYPPLQTDGCLDGAGQPTEAPQGANNSNSWTSTGVVSCA
jgi:hypothetical protein